VTRHSVVTIIAAHPSRREHAEALDEQVNAAGIVWDTGEGEWDTMARAWAAASVVAQRGSYTHALVLQDDAIPVTHLASTILEAIDRRPNDAISLYLGREKPAVWAHNVAFAVNVAANEGFSWLRASHLLHGVALVLPVPWIEPMLRWCVKPSAPYDERVGYWLRHIARVPVYYPQPSPVDHNDQLPSLVRHADDHARGTAGRIAYSFGYPTWDAPDVLDIITPTGAPA